MSAHSQTGRALWFSINLPLAVLCSRNGVLLSSDNLFKPAASSRSCLTWTKHANCGPRRNVRNDNKHERYNWSIYGLSNDSFLTVHSTWIINLNRSRRKLSWPIIMYLIRIFLEVLRNATSGQEIMLQAENKPGAYLILSMNAYNHLTLKLSGIARIV